MDLFSTTAKIALLARSGLVKYARELFDKMPERDTVAWNSMLTAYAQLGLAREAMSLFSDMRVSGTRPDPFTLTSVLSTSAAAEDISSGRKAHALVFSFGFQSHLPVGNSLVDMYGKCSCPLSASRVFDEMGVRNEVTWCSLLFGYVKLGYFEHALRLFDEMPVRKTIAWNILIVGYTRFKETQLVIDLFKEMQVLGFKGDVWTFSSLMNACTELEGPCSGCMIHASIVKSGWNSMVVVNNSILSFYAKFGCQDDAIRIFNSTETRTQVSWNAMIDTHMKAGDICKALSMFQRAPETNVVSWTAMIGGYARNGHGEQALALFVSMMRRHLQPDEFTFGAVLHACANLAVLEHGKMIHGCVVCNGFDSHVYTGNGLVNMYAKCGEIERSIQVFNGILSKDLVSWNAMLFGLALHGWVSKVFSVYEEMLANEVSPDKVTFIGLLMACSHSGLIEQGRRLFKTMQSVHGVPPDADHVDCMVDMLGRAGHLKEASALLEEYARTTDQRKTNSCEALLGACAVHGDVGIGRKVGQKLMTMEPQKEVGYVMLSNLYCASGQWKEAEKVRKVMVEQGVKKLPGCSWIEVRNMVLVFVTGTHALPQWKSVHRMLGLLESEMRNPNFYPRFFGGSPHD